MHENSMLLFSKYAAPVFKTGMKVLEIGPDKMPSTYREALAGLSLQWDTLDIYDRKGLTYCSRDQVNFPVEKSSYDVVISGQVIYAVRRPWLWVAELARIAKIGGRVITIAPVSWPYVPAPVDCWRIYPEGMATLYEDAELSVELCVLESLETPYYKNYIPGMSREHQSRNRRLTYKWFGPFRLPVERSYDTIAIGRKR